MQKQVEKVLGEAIDFAPEASPEKLLDLAEKLAKFSTLETVNEGGSKLRERGYALAGAIVDWAHELYPDYISKEETP